MTAYKNYIDDFPERCLKVLERYGPASAEIGLEVTLLLAIASASIIVPFERLRPAGQNRPAHVLGDRQELGAAIQKFDSLLDGKFLGSDVWPQKEALSWQYATTSIARVQSDPEQWTDEAGNWLLADDRSAVRADRTCDDILLTIRNALAHGNIKTLSHSRDDVINVAIKKVVFISVPMRPKPTDDMRIVAVTPENLRKFLKNWVQFLGSLKIPGGIDGEVAWVAAAAA